MLINTHEPCHEKPNIRHIQNKVADQRFAFAFASQTVQVFLFSNPNFPGPVQNPDCWFSHDALGYNVNTSRRYPLLIYWLLCFEQVSNKHTHLFNKGSFDRRCISFAPFIRNRSIISGGKVISLPVDICFSFFFF